MTCKTCGGRRVVTYIADTCNPEREGPCPSCVGIKIAGGDAIPAGMSAVMGRILGHYSEDPGTLARIKGMVAQYREAPFRSAEWLAGEIMRILDSEPANDTTPKPPAGGDAGADAADILDQYASFIRNEVKADDLEQHPYLPHIEQVAADLRAALALPAPVVEGDAETVAGRVGWHTSEEGGGPDVGISVGLGNGSALWIGELLDRDGGPVGIVFHGPAGARHAARLTELDEVRDLFEHHVAPAIAALSEGRRHG